MAENVKVILRVRPLNASEISKNSGNVLTFPGKNNVAIGGKTYTFDGVLPPTSTQEEVYKIAGMGVVDNVIAGYNGTVFAYGQTSSGKTHTMIGKTNDSQLKGLVPRIVRSTFDHIAKLTGNLSFLIKISYLEIYLEKIRDLLDISKDNLPICEDINKSTYVKGATEKYINSPEEIFDALEEGKANRKTAQTAMNADSSRSHSIFCFYISQEDNVSKKKLFSRLYLVDLAGSEKVSKTAAEGQTLEEAKNINKSLSCLGNVINALVEGASHIPYRDSKLTRMLQESLGGNAITTMVICVSPAAFNEAETKSTILFGTRVKTIKNIVMVNMELSTEEWKKQYVELRTKYNNLLSQHNILETEVKRWRSGEKVPQGEWAKEYTEKLKEDPIVKDITDKIAKPVATDNKQANDLYKDLDHKDEEIAIITQSLRQLEKELAAVNDQVVKLSQEKDEISKKHTKIQGEFEGTRKDLKDILPALEEMATSVAQKTKELEIKQKESEKLQDSNDKLQKQLRDIINELNNKKDGEVALKNLIIEVLREIKRDLVVVAAEMNESITAGNPVVKLEDELNGLKIFVSKIKAETKNFVAKGRNGLVGKEGEPYKKIEILEKQIENIKRNAEERIIAIINEKRKSEVELNKCKRELIKNKTDAKLGVIKDSKSIEKIQGQVKAMVENYIKDLNEAKQEVIDRVKENQEIKDKLELVQAELDIMRKSGLGLDTLIQLDKREQTKNELKGLEDNVNREILTLNTLRKLFLTDLKTKINRISLKPTMKEMLDDEENEFLSAEKLSPHQKERMTFLETNLDNLTKVHKKLVRDNAELRNDMPKMERRLKASNERIKQLEQALKEAKESTLKEHRKYQSEVDRIKETIRGRNQSMRILIAKPIQAGGAAP